MILSIFLALSFAYAAGDPGVKIGQTVPGFRLTDQNGQPRTLQDLRGPKGLMLVFFRSADW